MRTLLTDDRRVQSAPAAIEHRFVLLLLNARGRASRRQHLLRILRSTLRPPVLVFCATGTLVDRVVAELRHEQFHAAGLHGDKSFAIRAATVQALRVRAPAHQLPR